MKVQLVSNCHKYSGYKHVSLDGFKKLIDNSCEEILVYSFLPDYTLDEVANLFFLFISKLRKNGTLSFNFVNFKSLRVYDLDTESFNGIIGKSNLSIDYAKTLCEKHGLKVLTYETENNYTTMNAVRL